MNWTLQLNAEPLRARTAPVIALSLLLVGSSAFFRQQPALATAPEPLRLEVFTADDSSWGVTSTLIYGKTEAVLIDGQFHTSQAKQLAERIATLGRRLNAIIITHPDDDHYFGLAVLHERFPGAKIYLTEAALEVFRRTAGQELARQRKNVPAEMPDSVPAAEALPTTLLLVDGQPVLVIKDFQGDVKSPMNSFVWVPSLHAVVAGDIVFDGIHPWLADSNEQTRTAWLQSLEFIAGLHPLVVVPGHKGDPNLPDSPSTLDFMRRYLSDFESAQKAATTGEALIAAVKQRYPDLKQEKFLVYAVKATFPPPS